MWEQMKKVSRRQSSRKSVAYVLSAFIAVFLWMFALPNVANAAEAAWNNNSILYSGHQYIGPVVTKENEIPQLTKDATYYTYVETITERPLTQKAHVIYFSTGVDPGNATTASYIEYSLKGRVFSDPSGLTAITIAPKGTSSSNESSCSVSGIGWVICPISTFLASGMDWIFSVLRTFIEVQPVNITNPNSDLFAAWNVMRNISNIVFTIAFLIIIYSQITSLGISNYGIKKMLPRLIVAALLVNLSYYICAVAIDISNILGYAMQDLFMNIRNGLFHITDDTMPNMLTWQSMTGAVLGGSALALGSVIGAGSVIAASGGAISGMIFLLLPALLGLFLTTLVVLLILAARQALIVILVIIAPLAFVANLLPNTEKWYEKWKSTFSTMLIFFPAFSVVFGGSQLAGAVIIQNANSILMIVLGMIVQVAPLMITPLLLKFSGGVLGKVAGIVNNPKKGILDRTRNWSKDRTEASKYKKISGPIKSSDFLGRTGRYMEYKSRQDPRKTEYYKQRFGSYEANRRFSDPFDQQLEVDTRNAKAQTKNYEDRFDTAYEDLKAGDASTMQNMRRDMTRTQIARDRVNTKLGQETVQTISRNAINRTVYLDQESRIISSAKTSAQNIQTQNFANLIRDDETARRLAGGIDTVLGPQRALANAYNSLTKIYEDSLKNLETVIKGSNAKADDVLKLANGAAISSNGITIDATVEARAAAGRLIFGGKDANTIVKAYENIDLSFSDVADEDERKKLQVVFADAMISGDRAPWVGGGTIANLKQGLDWTGKETIKGPYGPEEVYESIIEAVRKRKISAKKLGSMGTDYLGELEKALASKQNTLSEDEVKALMVEIENALDKSGEIGRELGDSEPIIKRIENLIKPRP